MSKTIKLNSDLEYQKQLKEFSEYLLEVEQNLLIKGLNLAMQNKWKKWATETESKGEISFIDVNGLRDSGDQNIDHIVELIDTLLLTKNKIDNQE